MRVYGTAYMGGVGLCNGGRGVVFKLAKTGKGTVLYSFTGGADGVNWTCPLNWDKRSNEGILVKYLGHILKTV